MTSLATFEMLHFEQLALFTTVMLWWALMRPMMVRDYDNRRLPYNPTARLIVAFMYVLIYVALAVTFHLFGQTILPFLQQVPFVNPLVKSMENQAPLLAIATLAGLWQVAFFRDIERAFLVTMHSARHLRNDVVLLSQHLERCPFNPTETERRLNLNHLKKYGVFVKDDDAGPVEMVTVNNWRKVSSLLRVVQVWNEGTSRVLSTEEMKQLEDIETAHERKTQLAMNIIKMIQQVAEGKETTKLLSDLMKRLSTTALLDRGDLGEVEARAKSILGAGVEGGTPLTVRLSATELRTYVHEIEGYFEAEYAILLQQLAGLTAKSAVLAGEASPERLEQLKAIGFMGLGRIERISLDSVLWLFLVAAFGGFLIMYVGNISNIGNAQGQVNPEALARFAFSMAVAGLIGAVVGSIRRHARAPHPPWGIYFAAGLASAALYIGFVLILILAKELLQIAPADGQKPFSFIHTAPWSLLPLMLTVAICYLARIPKWREFPQLGKYNAYLERTIDGLCVSGAVLVGYYGAVALHPLLNIELPPGILQRMAEWHVLPIPIIMPLQANAFLIGFFFVRDVRRVAHATIVDAAGSVAPVVKPPKLVEAVQTPISTPVPPTAA